MRRNILVLFIISLFLTACGQGFENDGLLDENSEVNKQIEQSNQTDEIEQTKELSDDQLKSIESHDGLANLQVHYIDAGQADATLFQHSADNKTYTILYDAGDWNDRSVVNYLSKQNISLIDLIIISHPHADHIGQLAPIIEKFDVGEVWFSGNTSSSKTFQRTVDAVMASNADYYEPRAGDEFDIGQLGIEVLHPSKLTGNLNEDSISIRFTYGDVHFVFTGDAYQNEELEMMSRNVNLSADILQLGHHGSRTSSHPDFIKAVNPDIAIYSAGLDNSYGHPHEEVVSKIESAGISLYGTDQQGTILVTTDGVKYEITSEKDTVSAPIDNNSAHGSQEKPVMKEQKPAKENIEKQKNEEPKESNVTNPNCIDLNNASVDDLQKIIHVGPERAELIIDQRPFKSVDDLTKVKGIGPASIADIKVEGNACVK